MTVLVNSFSAEYGGSTGSAVNIVTRSGGDRFHGDALVAFRPSAAEAALSGFTANSALSGNDLANDTLYLRQDHNFKADRNRFSTIGIQFAKDATGFFTVMAVWSPTPASEASFEVGDQVLSVNGSSTIGMTQEDLSSQLHGETGT